MNTRISFLFLMGALLFGQACGSSGGESVASFEADELRGIYELDVQELAAQAAQNMDSAEGLSKLGAGMGMMMLSALEIKVAFEEANQGTLTLDASALSGLMGSDSAKPEPHPFFYKIENDSVVFVKGTADTATYQELATLRKVGGDYSEIELVSPPTKQGKRIKLHLEKVE